MTKNDILCELWTSPHIDDIIENITGGHHLTADLKSELFLILSEMSEVKIVSAWTGKWMNYLIINIIMKQWRSSTSPFHKKYRPPHSEVGVSEVEEEGDIDWNLIEEVMKEIEKLPLVERELIKMRYKLGVWNKTDGQLRDTECKKTIYSYRKMEKRLRIGEITIDHNTIQKYHNKSIEKIKKNIDKNDKQ